MQAEQFSQSALQDDVAQLARLLGESHPDLYSAFGGPIAFHREVAHIMAAIPTEGLSARQFFTVLRPLVAALRDGHTRLDPPDPPGAAAAAGVGRYWVEWDIVDEQLYLSAVYLASQQALLGARLVAVDDIPLEELGRRMGRIRGYDNAYNNLVHLADALASPVTLADVLGRDEPTQRVRLHLIAPDGALWPLAITPSQAAPGEAIAPPTSVNAPEVNPADIGWGFLDEARSIACLRIDALMRYREAFESWRATGFLSNLGDYLASVARLANPGVDVHDVEAQIAAVPAATETLRELLEAIRRANSTTLLIDLRQSTGGNSLLQYILEYFLFGKAAMLTTDEGYQIPRFSPLYFANYQQTGEDATAQMQRALRNGGYDFTDEDRWRARQRSGAPPGLSARESDLAEALSQTPTFASYFQQHDETAALASSLQLHVLTAARTYSAGFDIAAMLVKHGARLVGVPSAQSGNCFIDALRFTLTNSALRGTISYKRSLLFPDDPAAGEILRPSVELTYRNLIRMRFDPHATIRLALETLRTT